MYRVFLSTTPYLAAYQKDDYLRIGGDSSYIQEEGSEGMYLHFDEKTTLIAEVSRIIHYSRTCRRVVLVLAQGRTFEELVFEDALSSLELSEELEVESHHQELDAITHASMVKTLIREHSAGSRTYRQSHLLLLLAWHSYIVVGLDLAGFDLFARDHRLQREGRSVPVPLAVYACLYLGLQDVGEGLVLDPSADEGTTIREAARFHPRKAQHTKARYFLPVYALFHARPQIPSERLGKSEVKYQAVAQDNRAFKQLKEQIGYDNLTLKASLYSMDWLDVKFDAAEVDYVLTFISSQDTASLDLLFYQVDFILADTMVLISDALCAQEAYEKYHLELGGHEVVYEHGKEFHLHMFHKQDDS